MSEVERLSEAMNIALKTVRELVGFFEKYAAENPEFAAYMAELEREAADA